MQSNVSQRNTTTEQAPDGAGRWALISLALSMLLSSLGISIANVALPSLAEAFEASFQRVQWVVLAYLLAVTITIVSAGRLGDLAGHRRMLIGGISLFAVASGLCGVVSSLWLLIGARALQGLGAAVLMALSIAFVRDTVGKHRTGSAMGLLGTMSAIGTALGPSLGGVLLTAASWRAIFLVMVPLAALNLFLAWRFLPASKPAGKGSGFDALGTLLLGLTLAAYALAATVGGAHMGWLNVTLLAAAVLGAGLFVMVEASVASPLIRLSEFRDAALSGSLVMNAVVSTVMMVTFVVGPFYLAHVLGLNAAFVGVVMSVGPVISALTGIPAGRIVDRLSASFVVTGGLSLMTIGAFVLVMVPTSFGVAGYVVGIAVLTPGYQLFQAANNTAVMMDVGPDRRGVVSGMLSLSRNLGLITGASVMGALFAFVSGAADGSVAHPETIATGMRITFAVAGAMTLAAIAVAFVTRGRPMSTATVQEE
ncbi:MAG TPA: MFS transporter [Mesorhizobium sp.]|jgi:MFS family permease|uniref:MFS transporter n=1 Tax=Mesorhizobium sp. TaxID=1871066 RepID=UPI002DDD417E|nr:MFS transporter [Mesorhizobium sp.]HEV2504506.1 MFS transporter [Mesorhizobium sp.]